MMLINSEPKSGNCPTRFYNAGKLANEHSVQGMRL
jgi:hypothetical protein